MENIFIISGKALKDARTAQKGVYQSTVADAIGIQRTTYTNWEAKESIEIDRDTMRKLEKVLKVSADVLTQVPHETKKPDILEHPVIKSLVEQSHYIMKRVIELEEENKSLRANQKN